MVDREEIAEAQRRSRALAQKVCRLRAEHELHTRVSRALIDQAKEIIERIVAAERALPQPNNQPKANPMAIGARQRWDVRFYEVSADRFRNEAAAVGNSPDLRDRLLRIAERFERLRLRAATSGDRGTSRREDILSLARRHVAEAEAHVERQKALVTKLSADKRYAAAAEPAGQVLKTLIRSHDIARSHLAELELGTFAV